MDIQNLIPIDYANQRVLLTVQLAEVYGTTPNVIKENYRYSKEYFEEGVHYFKLSGTELRALKSKVRSSDPALIGKFANCVYLWTYQGCVRHCKMLNTPEAWEMFNILERFYFGVLEGAIEMKEAVVEEPQEDLKECVRRAREQFARLVTELAVVYALLMSNFTVKIGMTKDLTDRIKQIQADTKLDTLDFASTPFMARDDAAALEQYLLDKFSAYSLGGEFFDVRFLSVKAALAE